MQIGWLGLGKLGLPCSLTLHAHGGHKVTGYDVSRLPARILAGEAPPPREEGITELLAAAAGYQIAGSVHDVVAASDVVFVAVQTPHAPGYEGITIAPDEPGDFEYAFLTQAVRDVCHAARDHAKRVTVVVVSSVLPGTTGRLIAPLMNEYTALVYSPAFIAMGTTIADYRDPEFVICGTSDPEDAGVLRKVFSPLHGGDRLFVSSIETAEIVKVWYNCLISQKITAANTLMEICHKTGADCDQVTDALSLATDRVVSAKYMRGGMGDGGACHPRDNIAMSWLAQRLHLSYDLTGEVTRAREAQTGWIASLARHYAQVTGLPIGILGKSYKPGSDLTAGSPALLLAGFLGREVAWHYDPYVDAPGITSTTPAVVVVATMHPDFAAYSFAPGSVVIDPFGYIPDSPGVTVIRVGRKT